MQLRMWMYDLAREQCPSLEHLRNLCKVTLSSGYNALGIYLEHRFAYPSTPWSHGKGAVTPETIDSLQNEFPNLQIMPFINLLGHFEGLMYTEEGHQFAEQRFAGLQACPCNPKFKSLCEKIIDDTIAAFSSHIIHVGGDETAQLGLCPKCAERVKNAEGDGKAQLYGEHMTSLVQRVIEKGRRPAVWGDMFFDHPTALEILPKETLIFDWQYFNAPSEFFKDKGFDVVCCPAVHTYNAVWCHLPQTEKNVRDHAETALHRRDYGICLTTWECSLFGNYETVLPIVKGMGKLIACAEARDVKFVKDTYEPVREAPFALEAFGEEGREWAQLMGIDLQDCGGIFTFTGIRSSIKCRLLLYSNPFLLWLRNREELLGEAAERAYKIADRAVAVAPNNAMRGVSEFLKYAIEFTRYVERAHQAYAQQKPGETTAALAPCRQVFDALEKIAIATNINAGGSLADVERCRAAKEHIEKVMRRIRQYGNGSLGYLPSFEMITYPKFVPHDQAAWWLINRWANE